MSEKGSVTFQMHPIGHVRSNGDRSHLEILEPYRPAMEALDRFSHVIVVWWANQLDTEEARNLMQCMPPYADGEITGVFACRSPYRPNPVALSVCEMISVDAANGLIPVQYIDAEDGTPIVDLKAYFPVSDRVRQARVPEWCQDWPEWVEDAHLLEI